MNELSAQLLKKVCSRIRYPLVHLGDSNASLLSVLRALGKVEDLKKLYRVIAGDERNTAVLKPAAH